jgi:hypothetical protein
MRPLLMILLAVTLTGCNGIRSRGSLAEVSAKDKMKLSQMCEQSAARYFSTAYSDSDRQTGDYYSSHYNQKRLECLMQVHEGAGIDAIFDPIEHKEVASRLISSDDEATYTESPTSAIASSQSEVWFNNLMEQ